MLAPRLCRGATYPYRSSRMKYEGVPVSFLVTGALICAGTLFQVGYFYQLGTEFLSLVGASDWVFSIAVIATAFAFAGGATVYFARFLIFLTNKMLTLDEVFPRFFDVIPLKWVLCLVLVGLFAAAYLLPVRDAGLTALLFSVSLALSILAWNGYERDSDIASSTIIWLCFGWGLTIFMLGHLYGMFGGRVCMVSFADGRQVRAVYMRSVQDGHLIRLAGFSYFLEKSTVGEIKCPMIRDTIVERAKFIVP